MLSTAFFLALTLLSAVVLVLFLLRAGAARAWTVWMLSATLPLLAALSASFHGQAQAQKLIDHYQPMPSVVMITTQGRQYRAVVEGMDAACLERSVRLRSSVNLNTPQGFIPIREDTQVQGTLPQAATVQALTIRGQLQCPHFSPSHDGVGHDAPGREPGK